MNRGLTRRTMMKATAATIAAAPAIITSKRAVAQNVIGQGDYQFECKHMWPKLPEPFTWQTTHNVAVDPDNNLYVIHEGQAQQYDHPSIFVFDSDGKFIRAFGQQFQGGGHGLEVNVENGTPYLYVSAYQHVKTIVKMTVTGDIVWQRYAPMASERYVSGEGSSPAKVWGRNRFMPTNFAFLPDAEGFLVADGYGAYAVHRYDLDGNWISSFGGPGKGEGKFNLPHGLWIDQSGTSGGEVIVADRANNQLQVLEFDGTYKKTVDGFGLPANVDSNSELILVPELVAQVTLLDHELKVVAKLGSDQDRILEDKAKSKGFAIRADEMRWQQGRFVHPHDACFDLEGNIYVAEWVSTGRITKLTRV